MMTAREANREHAAQYRADVEIEIREIHRDELIHPGQGRRWAGRLGDLDIPDEVRGQITDAMFWARTDGVASVAGLGRFRWIVTGNFTHSSLAD